MTVQTPIGVCCKGEKENYINSQRYRGEAVIQDVRQAKYDDSEHRTGDRNLKHPHFTRQEYSLAAFRWSNGNL